MANAFLDLLSYSGKYKYLSIIGCILSAISAVFLLIPFIYIYQIIEQLLTTMPNYNGVLIQNLAFNALIFGLMGYLVSLIMILIYISSLDSFNVPYIYPLSHLNFTKIKESFFSKTYFKKKGNKRWKKL